MIKITILVAVYNAEHYISQCLDSLLGQTLPDLQVVCVDDASTDASWQLLKAYEARDSRVEAIHLDRNMGQAKARNIGLGHAKGLYTCFVDSDDWLAADALQHIVDKFESRKEIDCVLFHCVKHFGYHEEEYPMEPFDVMSGYEAFRACLNWELHGIYAVRTALHKRFPYDESAHCYSDDNTTRLHYLHSRLVGYCPATYYYRQHEMSVTHRVSVRRYDYLTANESMKKTLIDERVSDDVLDVYENVRWLNVVDAYMFYFKYRCQMSATDNEQGLAAIKRAWKSIETRRLRPANRWKLGYWHACSWRMFCMQEELYFTLKKILGRLK